MKIQCDVCEKAEASVFCTADEAALCGGCDHRVHHANKLARKHIRFSLLLPQSKDSPLCDICQERRGFLFCQEDRAIFCKECDGPIHVANEITRKHNRFLLTGAKLSAVSLSPYSSSSSSSTSTSTSNGNEVASNQLSSSSLNNPYVIPSVSTGSKGDDNCGGQDCSFSTSNISEFLGSFPGWHMDDLWDPSSFPNATAFDHDFDTK